MRTVDMVSGKAGRRMVAAAVASVAVVSAVAPAVGQTPAPAAAKSPEQMHDVTPYAAVVVAGNTPLRCGDGMYYRVANLTTGQTLLVDGESLGWARVAYPAGTPAYVLADDATADEATQAVRLKTASSLKAFHMASDISASWKALLTTPMPEGTSLKWLETMKNDTGAVLGYKVVAPAGARGFVEMRSLRAATPDEARKAGLAVKTDGGASAPATGAKPDEKPEVKPAVEPGSSVPASKPSVVDLTEPIVPGGTTPGTDTKPAPGVTPAAGAQDPAKPAVKPATNVEPPKPRRIGTPEELESAFQSVRREPSASAEYDALIAEYDRSIESAGTSPERQFSRKQLERRRDAVKWLKDLRDRRAAIDQAKNELDERSKLMGQKIAELEAQRVYTIIGLMVPSTVYDGKRLPLMYRIQSVGSASPTTIGYLKPADANQLQTKVGQVVGVVGDSALDRSLMLNVISPTRVDVLQAAELRQPGSPSSSVPPGSTQAEVPPAPAVDLPDGR